MKKVSILITNYNYSKYINRCIRSCLDQNFNRDEYEIIIIDDNSNDGSYSQLNYWSDKENIRVIFNEKNLGLGASCNRGLRECRTPYVVRVDADDYINENLLLFLYYHAHYNKSHAVACDYIEVNFNEEICARRNAKEHPIACGILFRLDCLEFVGGYSNRRVGEETELRDRFDKHFNVEYLNLPLYKYLKHENSLTSKDE
jgi:glycosyltransferase involved in cell wall biosynthesis